MNSVIVLVFTFLFQVGIVFAQNPYIREGSIGKQKEQADAASKGDFPFRPVEKWVGEKFIFLPKPKSLQEYGYQSFVGFFKDSEVPYGRPTYVECVGRIGTIIKATVEEITIKMDDDGRIYKARVLFGSVDGIAPLADIDNARVKYLGKTLWHIGGGILTYNHKTAKFGTVDFKQFSPVKVVDIVLGWDSDRPVRFILKAPSGEEGFRDVTLSGTNVFSISGDKPGDKQRFSDYFLTEDPRKTHRWPEEVWAVIEKGEVFVGMTAEQARMSLGEPKEINRTITGNILSEQWVYRTGSYLYFKNGMLTGIQY